MTACRLAAALWGALFLAGLWALASKPASAWLLGGDWADYDAEGIA